MDGEEANFVWESMQDLRLIFHPRYAREGRIDYSVLADMRRKKQAFLILDRNLLSGLLALCRHGSLRDENEMRIIGLLMTWVYMNDFVVSGGLAITEVSTKTGDSATRTSELRSFRKAFDWYPCMMWLHLAEGVINEIPVISANTGSPAVDVGSDQESEHLLMHIAEMLHCVYLYRRRDLSPIGKMVDFLRWNYENLLICESTLSYAAMLFTNQCGIKPPRYSGSSDMQRILEGCRNQAWDLTYLSAWSCLHYYEDSTNEVFMFATNDAQLKRVFINTYADGGVGALLRAVFSRSDADKALGVIGANQAGRRKPDFGSSAHQHLNRLIEQEMDRLRPLIGCQR